MSSARWHRVTVLDPEARTGICSVCGPVRLRRRVRAKRGGSVEWSCGRKHSSYSLKILSPHRLLMGDECAICDYQPIHPSQLDVHHIDGNHSNNDPWNVATLCANCHRLLHACGWDGIAQDRDYFEQRTTTGAERERKFRDHLGLS